MIFESLPAYSSAEVRTFFWYFYVCCKTLAHLPFNVDVYKIFQAELKYL